MLYLGLRTPPLPATPAKAGTGHKAQTRDYAIDNTSILQSASPLATNDLVSHVRSATGRRAAARRPADRPKSRSAARDRPKSRSAARRPPNARRAAAGGPALTL